MFTGHQTARDMFPPDMQPHLPQNGKTSLYYKDLPGDCSRNYGAGIFEAIEPLRAAGKLGAVHFQFAPWVICNPHGIRHVEHCADVMAHGRLHHGGRISQPDLVRRKAPRFHAGTWNASADW